MPAIFPAPGTGLPAHCRPVDGAAARPNPRDGVAVYCPRGHGRDASYYLHLPPRAVEGAGVLVVVHGISCNALAQVQAFGARAARLGLVTIAPLFARKRFPAYQRLGHSRKGVVSSPHVALQSMLDEVADATGADTARPFLFGFSGGAQFAHRYVMRFPDRVRAAALGSAGWYTFPDVDEPYPRGLGATPLAQGVDPARFLRVPTLVLVGEDDYRRDPSLNVCRAIDLQQGRDRIERARRWRDAMHSLAQRGGIEARLDFDLMQGCGHDFDDCVHGGGLVGRVLEFFATATATTATATTPRRRRDRAPDECGDLVFTAGR